MQSSGASVIRQESLPYGNKALHTSSADLLSFVYLSTFKITLYNKINLS